MSTTKQKEEANSILQTLTEVKSNALHAASSGIDKVANPYTTELGGAARQLFDVLYVRAKHLDRQPS